jgi:hypothetical protein
VTAGLVIFSWTTFRSVGQNRRATDEAMASMRQQEAFQQLTRVALHFSGFLLDRARLPRDLAELQKDRSPRLSERELIDPWGTPLRYEILEPQPMWFRLSSAGSDRTFGTEDDLVHQVGGKER